MKENMAISDRKCEHMRILVFSDSHSGLSFMKRCVTAIHPDLMIHLGDYYEDGAALHELFPQIQFYQVPGNCDSGSVQPAINQILIQRIDGVDFYMTHGHLHGVKTGTANLLAAARVSCCQMVLYGHTHRAECYRDASGLWVMNPGTCGFYGGSAGLIETADGNITSAKILHECDLAGIG